MSETLFLFAVLLLLIGATGFYFFSRVAYIDKKIGLLESILLDLKMNMDMENQIEVLPPIKEDAEPFEPEDSEELKDDAVAMYSSVIENAASAPSEAPVVSAPDYDSMSREDLTALAEKRSLRVTKSMKKVSIVNLLRETDKAEATGAEATPGKGAGAGASSPSS